VIVSGFYDATLVTLSILIATMASYTALDLAGRIAAASGWARHAWFATAALAMGGGIWSMHFIGMLAFRMPGMDLSYDVGLTILSLLVPIVVAGAGFYLASQKGADKPVRLAVAGLFMGLGIVAMHYTGMAAMRMTGHLSYDRFFVAVSVVIAIGASTVALWLAFLRTGIVQKLMAAVVMESRCRACTTRPCTPPFSRRIPRPAAHPMFQDSIKPRWPWPWRSRRS